MAIRLGLDYRIVESWPISAIREHIVMLEQIGGKPSRRGDSELADEDRIEAKFEAAFSRLPINR